MPDLIKTSLGVFIVPGNGFEIQGQAGSHQATVTVQGSGSVSASVTLRGSNDRIAWEAIGTASPSGTGAATAALSWTKDYLYWRADVASMTGDRVVVNVASDQAAGGSAPSAPSAAVTVTALSADRALAAGDLGANLVLSANRAVSLDAGLGDGYNTQFSNGSASSVTITVTPGSGVTLNGGTAAVTRTLAAGQTTALLPTGTNAYILPGA